jgi:TolA-binding protein
MRLLEARRARAPIAPIVVLLSLPLLVLVGATLAGCRRQAAEAPASGGDASSPGASAAGQSEAERTKAMEEKARELEKKASDIQSMEGTEQEKIDAVNKLEQERQDLNKTGGDGSAPAPPPPQ